MGEYISTTEHLKKLIATPQAELLDIKNALDFRGTFIEVFVEDQYRWLAQQLKPHTNLLDIGAHFGDTAFYFAILPNVDRIRAYEPSPRHFCEFMRLLEHSPYKGKIKPFNIAITNGSSATTVDDNFKYAKTTTLTEALKSFRNIAIKCDVEGAEETIFDDADLSQVYAIQLEWHSEGVRRHVTEVLRSNGFTIAANYAIIAPHGMICALREKRLVKQREKHKG